MRHYSPPCLGFDPSFLPAESSSLESRNGERPPIVFVAQAISKYKYPKQTIRSFYTIRDTNRLSKDLNTRIFLRVTEIIKITYTNKKIISASRNLRESSFSIMYCKIAVRKMNKLYKLRKHSM